MDCRSIWVCTKTSAKPALAAVTPKLVFNGLLRTHALRDEARREMYAKTIKAPAAVRHQEKVAQAFSGWLRDSGGKRQARRPTHDGSLLRMAKYRCSIEMMCGGFPASTRITTCSLFPAPRVPYKYRTVLTGTGGTVQFSLVSFGVAVCCGHRWSFGLVMPYAFRPSAALALASP